MLAQFRLVPVDLVAELVHHGLYDLWRGLRFWRRARRRGTDQTRKGEQQDGANGAPRVHLITSRKACRGTAIRAIRPSLPCVNTKPQALAMRAPWPDRACCTMIRTPRCRVKRVGTGPDHGRTGSRLSKPRTILPASWTCPCTTVTPPHEPRNEPGLPFAPRTGRHLRRPGLRTGRLRGGAAARRGHGGPVPELHPENVRVQHGRGQIRDEAGCQGLR